MTHSVPISDTHARGIVPILERDTKTSGIYFGDMLKDWLNDGLAIAGMSQAELARRLTEKLGRSYPRTTVNKMTQGLREIAGEELIAIAHILGLPMPGAEGSSAEPPELIPASERLVPIYDAGVVEAGAFRAAPDFEDIEAEPLLEAPDPKYPHARQVSWRVAGDSMNRLEPRPILAGDRIVCIDFEDLDNQVPLRDGMIVVVERTRDGGLLREWSVKQLEFYEDRVEFHPRSSNPKHRPIVVPRDNQADDGKEVRILALVRRIVNEINF